MAGLEALSISSEENFELWLDDARSGTTWGSWTRRPEPADPTFGMSTRRSRATRAVALGRVPSTSSLGSSSVSWPMLAKEGRPFWRQVLTSAVLALQRGSPYHGHRPARPQPRHLPRRRPIRSVGWRAARQQPAPGDGDRHSSSVSRRNRTHRVSARNAPWISGMPRPASSEDVKDITSQALTW